MRMLSTPDGALPIATSLTSQPVGPLNFDQSPPGSPTPTSARVTVPLAAHAGAHGRARPAATASPAPPAATRSRNSLRLTPGLSVPPFSMARPSWSGGGVGFPVATTSHGVIRGAAKSTRGISRPHHNADRRGLEPVTGVPLLRAVRDGRERVHLGAEVNVVTRPRQPLHDRHRAVGMNGHVHEPVDVGDDVLLAEPEGREGPQEVAAAVGRVLDAVAKLVAFRATAPADRVVAAAGILHDREEPPPHVRVDAVAPGEEDRPRVLHRIGGVVALLGARGVVAEEVDRLLALEVHDAQHLTRRDHAGPDLPGRNDAVLDDPFHRRPSFLERAMSLATQ